MNTKTTNALFVLCGNCRTFTDCIDSFFTHIVSHLFSQDVKIYIYLYLKLTDPGPKGQYNWNFEYKDNDYNVILGKIFYLKLHYNNINIDYKLLNSDEISDDELISQIKDINLYKGFFSNYSFLIRSMHCHYNFEKCGNYILEKEEYIKSKFDYIIYVRPDLYFTNQCNNIEKYNTSIVTLGKGPNIANNDHIAIIPRQYLNAFFFDRINIYRNNTNNIFTNAEQVYYHTIDYEIKSIGDYFIKRF